MFLRRLIEKKKKEKEEVRLLKKKKQGCLVPCPKCKNELVSSNSFVEDKDGIVKYKCTKCGNISFWDFIHYPVPYLRTCADCDHLYFNSSGGCECEINEQCEPDTMIKFEVKRKEN